MAEKLDKRKQPEEDPSPDQHSAGAGVTTSGEEEVTKKEEEVPEPKRRKKCPTALEEFTPYSDSNHSFSFTFDTKLGGPNSQYTPKFGSFNLEEQLIDKDGCYSKVAADDKEGGGGTEISGGAAFGSLENGIGIDRIR